MSSGLQICLSFILLTQLPDTTERSPISVEELWLKLTLSGSRQRLSLVIADFTTPRGTKSDTVSLVAQLQQVFTADLRFSLYFTFEEPESGKVYNFPTDPKKPDLKGWATTGAQILICGDYVPRKGNAQLNLRLYDLASSRLIASKPYNLRPEWRWLAHQMADDVIKLLTGEDGVSCTRIAFSRALAAGNKELAVVDYDGANLEQITGSGGLKLFPDWAPDGNRIAYCAYGTSSLNCYLLDLTNRKVAVISERTGLNTTPAISPDGKTIALSLSFEGNSEIYLLDINGRNLRRLTNHPAIDISPTWSPNGRQLAFVSDRTGTPQIYIINVDGTDLHRLTFAGSYNTSPVWSPKGDLIAFVQRQPDGANQICVTNILGDSYLRLTYQGNNEEPTWSPDGLHLAFTSNRTGTWEIWTMDWNGANQRQITRTGGAFSPTWSPRLRR
uniref:Tol-Pal system beta propeller repeat protein TolB n=1 Tax=candidate division WOR-3 bacterium TaxID=2052148 RepID=A0A7V3V088_UNCW3